MELPLLQRCSAWPCRSSGTMRAPNLVQSRATSGLSSGKLPAALERDGARACSARLGAAPLWRPLALPEAVAELVAVAGRHRQVGLTSRRVGGIGARVRSASCLRPGWGLSADRWRIRHSRAGRRP